MDSTVEGSWRKVSRVRLLGQPIGLGVPLAGMGGFLTLNMILATKPSEGWLLTLCTVLMALGFGAAFLIGVGFLLTPFEKVLVCPQEVRLCLGKLVLRRIPRENIRSVTGTTREIILRGRDCDLYRLKINLHKGRSLWLDWSTGTETVLKEQLTNVLFLI